MDSKIAYFRFPFYLIPIDSVGFGPMKSTSANVREKSVHLKLI